MDNGVDPVLRDQRGQARLVSDVAGDERRALRYCPIETSREVVEHHDALAGVDERMNHVASDIAGAAGEEDRHAGGPLAIAWRAGSGAGNIRLEACMHVLATADKPAGAERERRGF
jgi:hypothetical protein